MRAYVLVLFLLAACGQSPTSLVTFEPGSVHEGVSLDIAQSAEVSHGYTHQIELTTVERTAEVAPGVEYEFWTFDGRVPGPFLRVREGDVVELTLKNHQESKNPHSIDLHAVTGPGGGAAVTQILPGQNASFTFKALNPGLYVYHCATPHVASHIANGMYGLILVEPEEGLPAVDREYYVMQGELYTKGGLGESGFQEFSIEKLREEDPEYVVMNGRVNALVDAPLNASVGETVRLFVGNGGVSKVSSFHVIGEVFDRVYHEAGSLINENVQSTIVPAGGASIVDFRVDVPGDYVLVDHALARLERGAWGVLRVDGGQNASVFSS